MIGKRFYGTDCCAIFWPGQILQNSQINIRYSSFPPGLIIAISAVYTEATWSIRFLYFDEWTWDQYISARIYIHGSIKYELVKQLGDWWQLFTFGIAIQWPAIITYILWYRLYKCNRLFDIVEIYVIKHTHTHTLATI